MPAPVALAVPAFTAPNELTGAITGAVTAINSLTTASASPPSYGVNLIAGDKAINPHISAMYMVTKGSVCLMTLAAPTTGVDDGVTITITSNSTNQHTLTATGLLNVGTVKTDVATWPAFAGGSITLMAYAAKWYLIANNLTVLT